LCLWTIGRKSNTCMQNIITYNKISIHQYLKWKKANKTDLQFEHCRSIYRQSSQTVPMSLKFINPFPDSISKNGSHLRPKWSKLGVILESWVRIGWKFITQVCSCTTAHICSCFTSSNKHTLMAWCKTIVTLWRSYNSPAPSHRFLSSIFLTYITIKKLCSCLTFSNKHTYITLQ